MKQLIYLMLAILTINACHPFEEIAKIAEIPPCIDGDGNVYDTIHIGNQVWMKENLRTTSYSNGVKLVNITDNNSWINCNYPAYCWYKNDSTTYVKHGAFYNWYVADTENNGNKNVCPVGWHVPSKAEWQVLIDYLGGTYEAPPKLREEGTSHWGKDNIDASNSSGFTVIPVYVRWGENGKFGGDAVFFWSSTEKGYVSDEAVELLIDLNATYFNNKLKSDGFSIRCVANSNKN